MLTPSQIAAAEDIAARAQAENRDLTSEEYERYDALMRGLTTEQPADVPATTEARTRC